MTLAIPKALSARLAKEAKGLRTTVEERALDILQSSVAPEANLDPKYLQDGLKKIAAFLARLPAVQTVATSKKGEAFWWLKFGIDLRSKIAWSVVQELAHVVNYLSVSERLPTKFYPVSPPPYLNGGPEDFLSWIIEPTIPYVDTAVIHAYLQDRLPKEPEKEESWAAPED